MSTFFLDSFVKAVECASVNDDKKLVTILGSGFHRRYQVNLTDLSEQPRLNILYDWQKLLDATYDNYPFSSHYLTDGMRLVVFSIK